MTLTPDIGMLGYLFGNIAGAVSYNMFHHKATVISTLILGWWFNNEMIELAGIILFGHASLDRLFGYGLKHFKGFKHTHLGVLP